MAIFGVTGKGRKRSQAARLRAMWRMERGMTLKIRKELNKQYIAAAALVEQGVTDVDVAVDRGTPNLLEIFTQYYTRAGVVFSSMVFKEFNKDIAKGSLGPIEAKGMEEEYWQSYKGFMSRNAAEKVVGISAATKRALHRVIKRGAFDGLSYSEVAKKIRKARSTINRTRAIRIARTEIHGASNYATDEAVNSTRVEFDREWTALFDDRTRITHTAADGQIRKQGVPFRVGGEDLMFPGDPKGSPGNIINCRCVVMYHPAKGGQQ